MMPYNRHAWFRHVFARYGSVLPHVFPRMVVFVGISVVILHAYRLGKVQDIPPMVHAVLGTVLGLILAFRTNTAYDRFWEGRRAWGLITNRCRDLARQCASLFRSEDDKRRIAKLLSIFGHGAKRHLWRDSATKELTEFFSAEEAMTFERAPGVPQRALLNLTDMFVRAKRDGQISELTFSALDRNLTELLDQFGACQRIQRTPIPFAYVIFIRRFIIAYLVTLPLALVQQMGWGAPFIMLIVSYAMLGIEELGVQIEDPFERSPSDINLERLSRNIQRDVMDILGGSERVPHSLPPYRKDQDSMIGS